MSISHIRPARPVMPRKARAATRDKGTHYLYKQGKTQNKKRLNHPYKKIIKKMTGKEGLYHRFL